MDWAVLVASGVMEAVWAIALGKSEGFSRPLPTAIFGIATGTEPASIARIALICGLVACIIGLKIVSPHS